MLILKWMRFSLYTCMEYLYEPPVVVALAVEIIQMDAAEQEPPPPRGGKAPAALSA